MVIGVDLVLATRPNAKTGIERYALNLFHALRAIDPTTIGYVDRASATDLPGTIRVRGGLRGWLSFPLSADFKRHRPDVLLCPAFPPSPAALMTGLPVARIIHDDFPWTQTLNLRGRVMFKHYEALGARRYRWVYAPTRLMAEPLARVLGRQVEVIGNAPGIDLALAPQTLPRLRQVIAVGTIEPRKNYQALVAALDQLPGDWKAAVVGRRGWGPIAAAWDEQIATHDRRLEWHGQASDDELLALYQQSSCFVSMSLAEGFNMPLVEAGSLGLPVVVSDIPIHRGVAPPWARFVPLSATAETLAQAIVEASAMVVPPTQVEEYRRTFSWDGIARELKRRLQL